MRPSIPYDPRVASQRAAGETGPPPPRGMLAELGRSGLDVYATWAGVLRMLLRALAAALTPGRAAAGVVRRITVAQIFFTGAQGLPYVTATALVIGATMMIQMRVAAAGLPGEIVGKILVTVVLRELAPLVTAIIVASRSGTAIATELGNMKASLEVLGLSSLGIDPARYVVLPRLVAVVVSILVLTVYFAVLALAGSFAVAAVFGSPEPEAMHAGLAATLGLGDLLLFLVKGIGCGAMVAVVSCYFGMRVRSSITEVPMMSGQAVIRGVLGCVLFNFAVTLGYYSIFGTAFAPL